MDHEESYANCTGTRVRRRAARKALRSRGCSGPEWRGVVTDIVEAYDPLSGECDVLFHQGALGAHSGRTGLDPDLDAENMPHTAMNIAAITGPMTTPLTPRMAIPPSVEISTT